MSEAADGPCQRPECQEARVRLARMTELMTVFRRQAELEREEALLEQRVQQLREIERAANVQRLASAQMFERLLKEGAR